MARALSITIVLLVSLHTVSSAEDNWPRWRGPHQNGHAYEKGLPEKWSDSDVAWKTPLPGRGQSSPVIWGDRIFLTTALERGRQRVVLCVNRNDGQLLWRKVVWTGEPEPSHKMNGWASATCATDGERVYAFFGHGGGLFCLTVEGDLVWNVDNSEMGDFAGPWGVAACPVLFEDLVIQNCDADENAYLAAYDKKTGKQVWKTDRPDIRGWSTPIFHEVDGQTQLVLNGHYGITGYDPRTGKQLWTAKDDRGRGSPTATPVSEDLLIAASGRGTLYAVRPGTGVVPRVWSQPRKNGRDLPSPIVLGDYLLIVNKEGILSCYEAETGKNVWMARLDGKYAAAPVAWNGKAFFVNEAGVTSVVEPGPQPNVVSLNKVDAEEFEVFRASITPSRGQLFLRSDRTLYCVGERAASE